MIPTPGNVSDLICLSHLRWDFVYQRPQHLMSRFAKRRRVFYIEEPLWTEGAERLEKSNRDCGVVVIVPHLHRNQTEDAVTVKLSGMLSEFFSKHEISSYCLWYYTPMAIPWTAHLKPAAVVYDCMDELTAFKNAPVELKIRETALFSRADLVFTGGHSLFEAKRHQHSNVFAFPSSIDVRHFAQGRWNLACPEDQQSLPRPRIGYCGVIDERMDLDLLAAVADARKDWQLIMVGPVVKIDQASLPKNSNIHYLGMKSYEQLPHYIGGWDVAMLPFARNESTRFISPTKTPEYLAAGRPVVSTSIPDVVRPYGTLGLARIADHPYDFIAAVEDAIAEDSSNRVRRVDEFLSHTSWSETWGRMDELLSDAVQQKRFKGTLTYSATAGGTVGTRV